MSWAFQMCHSLNCPQRSPWCCPRVSVLPILSTEKSQPSSGLWAGAALLQVVHDIAEMCSHLNSLHSCFDLYCSKYSILEQRHWAFGHLCHCASLASRAKRWVSPGPQEQRVGSKKQLFSQQFKLFLNIIIPFPSPKPTDQSLRLSEIVLIACQPALPTCNVPGNHCSGQGEKNADPSQAKFQLSARWRTQFCTCLWVLQ